MHNFFYGWYLKCQSASQTLAVIPAVHQSGRKTTCSIQLITDDNVWTVPFSADAFHRAGMNILISENKPEENKFGRNKFGKSGIRLSIHTPELRAEGKLDFGPLSPLRYDIMGPFALMPFMECRHSVWSMRHSVRGTVHINEREYSFKNGCGYWEGDRGQSFPQKYVWSQCCFPHGSLMLSVADIPIAGFHFTGIICNVLWKGKEYRLATYLGAKLKYLKDQRLKIAQGDMELEACLLEAKGHPLKAPANGNMIRTIHESASCTASYSFRKKGHTLFAFETDRASFEYEYPY